MEQEWVIYIEMGNKIFQISFFYLDITNISREMVFNHQQILPSKVVVS
jgi:hypothetical protein